MSQYEPLDMSGLKEIVEAGWAKVLAQYQREYGERTGLLMYDMERQFANATCAKVEQWYFGDGSPTP